MNQSYIVFRRDMLGESCLLCDLGEYSSRLGDDAVVCKPCGHRLPRWLTKREILMHGMAAEYARQEEAVVEVSE